jgi:hypothetical protein
MMDDQFMDCRSGARPSRLRRNGIHAGLAGRLVIFEGKGFHDEGRIFRERNLASGFMIWVKVQGEFLTMHIS